MTTTSSTRQIVLDTETTGLEPVAGHRIIEIGAIEMLDRRPTGRRLHQYLNPDRSSDPEALAVHGISDEFLSRQPRFADFHQQLLDFLEGAELVIHNAEFDLGFLHHELQLANAPVQDLTSICTVLDTLLLAREMHPGQPNSLDALCRRYEVDNSNRQLHGALRDAELLLNVFLAMTGEQKTFNLDIAAATQQETHGGSGHDGTLRPVMVAVSDGDRERHLARLRRLGHDSGDNH